MRRRWRTERRPNAHRHERQPRHGRPSWINGDDLLFGSKNSDTLIGKTGDDRFIMTAGTDTVYGDNQDGTGAFDLLADRTTKQFYQDVLQAEEATFGTGTRFSVTWTAPWPARVPCRRSTGAVSRRPASSTLVRFSRTIAVPH